MEIGVPTEVAIHTWPVPLSDTQVIRQRAPTAVAATKVNVSPELVITGLAAVPAAN